MNGPLPYLGFILAFLTHFTFAQYNPLKDPNICGRPTCSGATKFQYGQDNRYLYDYSVDISSLFNGTSKNESTLHVEALVTLDFISECDGILSLSDLKLIEKTGEINLDDEDYADNYYHPNSQYFSEEISQYPLRFSFNDGKISELCPYDEEPNWVLNFKRGVLSMLHNSMKRFDLDHTGIEKDVRGICETDYKIVGAKTTSLLIEKTKNLNNCESRSKLHSVIQSTPYQFKRDDGNLIQSTSFCELSIDRHIYNDINCTETHVFQPFSNQAAGATTSVKQRLILKREEVQETIEEQPLITKRSSLLYDQVPTPKPTSGELKESRDLLKQLCKVSAEDVQAEFSDLFTKFIHTSRLLSNDALTALYEKSSSICISGKKHMLDAMPFLGSSAAVSLMNEIIMNQGVNDDTIHDWMISIAFISRPNEEMIETVSQLLKHKNNDSSVVLAISSLTHTFCVQNFDCQTNEFVNEIIDYFQTQIGNLYSLGVHDNENKDKILVSLKALANIGVVSDEFQDTLFEMIRDSKLDVAVKVAAIRVFRRLPCEEVLPMFQEIFKNQDQDAEVRIGSYLQVMQCPNYLIIRGIRQSLQVEEVNQVGSFIWSHLQNLLKSSIPSRVEIQSLLSDKDLGKKFSSDVRKFSHNYEGSIFFEEYNVGANYESNVIFSPSSYIPKAAMLNLTVDLFGESINLLEVNGRVEGFEHYLESIFGPKGPLYSDKLIDLLPKMRWPRSASENEILKSQIDDLPNAKKPNFGEPMVSLGLKVFGNELKHGTFNGEKEIKDALRTLNPIDHLKHILSGKEINYNKAAMFLDSSYVIPSAAGFPITLNAVGTASVNLKLFGSLRAADFARTKEFDLVGDIRPSAALDVVGTMSVDAFVASTAIKLKTNMYTSSAIEGNVKIRGSDLVSVKFSFPREKTEIFGAQSELIVMNGGVENRQKGLENKRVSQSACSWPLIDKTMGLKLCTHYHFTNVTKLNQSPYFILAGPAEFKVSLEKADPTAKTYFMEYKWNKTKTANIISLIFDTPGSSTRRLMGANLTFDTKTNNVTLLIHSTNSSFLARGKYKNAENEKYLQIALDIDDKKHLNLSVSLERKESRNGHTYTPKFYLGVNSERVAELQGSLKWVTKKGISQCDVDLKFQTKRLTSKLFGYISKSDASIGTNLKLDYKFVNTKEHRAILDFSLANRSTRTMVAILGNIRIETTAYSHFNFDAALKFQRAAGRLECKIELYSSPNLRNLAVFDPNRLTAVVEIKHKTMIDGTSFETKISVNKPATDLDLGAEFSYYVVGPQTDLKFVIRYSKEKEAIMTIYWLHPRGIFEHVEGKVNVTIPSYNPMVLKWKVHEKRASDYDVDLSATWFTGHNATLRGVYQDKSNAKASNHHLKFLLKSPSFQEIDADCQFYRDNLEIKIDLKANHNKEEYGIFYKHVTSPFEISTQGKIKYKTKLYSVTSLINLRDRKQIVLELHFDQYRDIHLAMWAHNKEIKKTAGLEIKWDANRDPNQKLAVTVEYSNPESYNYAANFIVAYPGRTINGVFDFNIKGGHFFTQTYLTWNPTDRVAFKFNVNYQNDIDTLIIIASEFITPFEDWRKTALNIGYHHNGNMYRINGSVYWHHDQHVSINLFRDYVTTKSVLKYEFTGALLSNVKDFPSFSVNLKHYHNGTKIDTNLHLTYHPQQVVAVKSSWQIDEDNKMKNLTGTISLISPIEGYHKGLLVSKIYVTNNRELRGVADLDLDYKKYTASVEGYYKKFSKNMFVYNITTPLEKYQKLTGRLGFNEDDKHVVALVEYPTGTLGIEFKLLVHSLEHFDVKFFVGTPIDFIKKIMVVGLMKPKRTDFRLGWNSLLAGFSGVWHYANITDFEYSYKIYTPIEGFEENGIVAKVIFKEGLDFEVSVKLAEKRLGITVVGKPKPKILNELGIKTQAIYNGKLAGTEIEKNLEDLSDDDYDYEDEAEEPISWSGLVAIDTVIYSTMKGTLDIDQKGTLYVVLGTLTLPDGVAELRDEFDFIDLLAMKNRLYLTTPYDICKIITSNYDFKVVMGSVYNLGMDFNYLNGTRWIRTGGSAHYYINSVKNEKVTYNVTLHARTPLQSYPQLDLNSIVKMDENVYRFNFALTTNSSNISVAAGAELGDGLLGTNVTLHATTPFVVVPPAKFNFKKHFSGMENKIEVFFDMARKKPSKINAVIGWKYDNITNLGGNLKVETPLRGMERVEIGTSLSFANRKGVGDIYILLHPINFRANATVKDNELQSWMRSEFQRTRQNMVLQCSFTDISPSTQKVDGKFKMNGRVYIIGGEVELSREDFPIRLNIQIDPQDGRLPFHIEYHLQTLTFGHMLNIKLSQEYKFIQIGAKTNFERHNEMDVHLQISTSNKRYTSFIFDAQVVNEDIKKSLTVKAQTPFQNLENPHLVLLFTKLGEQRNVNVIYQGRGKGKLDVEWCWIQMENMAIKLVGNFESANFTRHANGQLFYINPNKNFNAFQIGGNANLNEFWATSGNLKLNMPSMHKIDLNANLKMPSSEIYNADGKLYSSKRLDRVEYLIKYQTKNSKVNYGSTGNISYINVNDFTGSVDANLREKYYFNYLNWQRTDENAHIRYRLLTPKFNNQDTVNANLNYKGSKIHRNVTCEIFYPANRSVAAAFVDFQQFANMNGTINVTTPFKKYNYIGAHFKTETSGIIRNRYIQLLWPNNTAILDSVSTTTTGVSALERNTVGVVKVEIPLTTRHISQVDYSYSELPNNSTGNAVVNYMKEKILEGRYNCLSLSQAGFDKDTIHVELENKWLPLGATYVHGYEYSAPRDGSNTPTVDSKRLEVYHLHNRTGFNVTGETFLRTTFTGQQIALTAIHSNRAVKFWTAYDVLDHQFKQHSKLELSPTVWIAYDIDLINKTMDEDAEVQQIEVNISYPTRNFTALGSYNVTNSSLLSEMSLLWDEKRKTVETALNWIKNPSLYNNHQLVELQLRHPSFEKNVSLLGEYRTGKKKWIDLNFIADYSDDPDHRLQLSGAIEDTSSDVYSNYTYKILGSHPATNLDLNARGGISWKDRWYFTLHQMDYKRTYLPLQSREAFGRLDVNNKEIELKKQSLRELSYLWSRYSEKFPLYTANISAIHGNDVNASGEFYLNFKEKLLRFELNTTEDGTQSLHALGQIPDARSAAFDIWRDYDDIRVMDVAYFLRLNHSRLIVSKLRWRPEIKQEIQNSIRAFSLELYNDFIDNADYWKQYIRSETADAVADVWQDAKPLIYNFLEDLKDLRVIEEDIEYLKQYLNNSYNANDFYMRDAVGYILHFVDELALNDHVKSFPNIVNEFWEVLGESGEKFQKGVLWVVDRVKVYYKNTSKFINGLFQGDAMEYVSEALAELVEKYDNFIKDMHVSFIRYIDKLWKQTYTMIIDNWHKTLASIEPTFIKIVHYLESVLWGASKEFLDFLYLRKSELIESPYFNKFATLSHDVDKFYKDITGNNTISNVYKYSKLVWNFLNEKYFKFIPFGKEFRAIATEITNELKELQNLTSIQYVSDKCREIFEKVKWAYNYFDIEYRIQRFITIVHLKMTDLTQNALEVENRRREAKTKFIFEPNDGIMYLEQKLPLSWHAFNETPIIQEIPEYKAINNIQNYFVASKTNFWNFYYDYKPYTDPTDWFPPFKAQAMLAGSQYFVTFDRTYYKFRGDCSYLLVSDFLDRNFSIAISYDAKRIDSHELLLLVNNTVIHIDSITNVIQVNEKNDTPSTRLPLQVGDLYVYQESDIVILESTAGFSLQCNMKFDVCMLELSGWYFGKTGGLWGTMNNEPSDDLFTSDGERIKLNNINAFAQSWALDRNCYSKKNTVIDTRSPSEEVQALCEILFQSNVSPFVTCFPRVPSGPFIDMCLNSINESDACTSAMAYMNLCAVENTPLRIPEACVKCNLLNGTTVPEGEFIRFDGNSVPRSTDVVFIVEAKECNKNLPQKRNTEYLTELLHKELSELNITQNRYSVVTFGGNGVFDLPRSVSINGKAFTDYYSVNSYFDNIPIGNGNSDIFEAIVFASKLVFRPGVSKTFILLPCTDCHESSMKLDYAILHQLLLENDITLHILMNEAFLFHKSLVSKIFFGIDRTHAYTKKDAKELKGDTGLLRQVRLPKSTLGFCTHLALETDGSVFSAKKLEGDKRNSVKRFATVFGKRVAQSALPSKCHMCECTAPNTGVSYMECFPCSYPTRAAINYGFNEDETLSVMQPIDEEEFDYSDTENLN